MASIHGKGFDDVIAEMRRMGDSAGEIAERMIDAGAEEVKKAWREVARERGHIDTGGMIESIASVAPRKSDPNAITREIYPQGKDDKGVRNAEKAYILHYGTSRIKADYWVDEADARAEIPMEAAMRAVWDAFIQGRDDRS